MTHPVLRDAGLQQVLDPEDDPDDTLASNAPPLDEERNAYVVDNLNLARYLARRFAHRGEPYDDLVQVASLALVKAASRFDPDRGVAFATFATTSIIGELRRYFRDHSRSIRVPRRLQSLSAEVGLAVDSLSQANGRAPTIREIALACGRHEAEVIEALEADRSGRPASLDETGPPGDGTADEPLGSRLASEDDSLSRLEELLGLSVHIQELQPEERTVLRLRFVEDLTQSEIAKLIGVSQMTVSRLLARALATLRTSGLSGG